MKCLLFFLEELLNCLRKLRIYSKVKQDVDFLFKKWFSEEAEIYY